MRSLATMLILMGSGHYFGKPDEYMAMFDTLIDDANDAILI